MTTTRWGRRLAGTVPFAATGSEQSWADVRVPVRVDPNATITVTLVSGPGAYVDYITPGILGAARS